MCTKYLHSKKVWLGELTISALPSHELVKDWNKICIGITLGLDEDLTIGLGDLLGHSGAK